MFDIRNITEDEAKKQKLILPIIKMMHHTLTMPLMTSCAA